MLKGRLGLQNARVPHSDRHGLLYLDRGNLFVRNGNLCFQKLAISEFNPIPVGLYSIPTQTLSMIQIGPGATISSDAFRILNTLQTNLVIIGENGVRLYSSLPSKLRKSDLARKQAEKWSDSDKRIRVARAMYTIRLSKIYRYRSLDVLRGVEGHQMKKSYQLIARQIGIKWIKRFYDRENPDLADLPNQAINHAATAVESAAYIAVNVTGTIPQLGFIHEDPGHSFVLDIADLFRVRFTIPFAFRAVKKFESEKGKVPIERITRKLIGINLNKEKIIPQMIDRIKTLIEEK